MYKIRKAVVDNTTISDCFTHEHLTDDILAFIKSQLEKIA